MMPRETPSSSDQWAAGTAYERYMGRWSRSLAPRFLDWLAAAPGSHWLDVGCGTGALTQVILARSEPASVVACDPAEPFIAFARGATTDGRATFVVARADDFPIRAGGYDCIASLLALNFFPAVPTALRRMAGALSAGGSVSACVWDYAAGMEFLRCFWDAAAAVKPAAAEYDEATRFPICHPEPLVDLFSHAGLHSVACEALDIPTVFSSFDEYWQPFLGGTGPAPAFVSSLSGDERERLRQTIQRSLPTAEDGTIALRARAWAVLGYR